ncbi:putative nucleotidyltransferase [Erythrobacter sp. NAP1]|uniref:nucleotidyltransferase domain-containing protein n=1 Tax=Erythrobacter sp. NAP1 TaxID=237727 RepID=UPI000068777B|nr:nucleotidyltransferase domain-containing protein [Erythrobacter sp. NAP1]EAQ28392.1 putative nucleotidyltransferase [Erythrobacter sp. NAP1]
MDNPARLFPAGSAIPAYLKKVVSVHREILGDDLIALYLHGSVVQDDFQAGSSDLDVLGVVSGPLRPAQRERLAVGLSHEALPVPAFGLELILCSADAVRAPVEAMPYDFALSTGVEWGTAVEVDGTTSDILVHMQLCRQAGLALVGQPPCEVLSPIKMSALRAALMGELVWHRNELRGEPSGQGIVNAVLNAARSLHAAETGEIVSKSEGAKCWLEVHPNEEVVAEALGYRHRDRSAAPPIRSARNFVELAIAAL